VSVAPRCIANEQRCERVASGRGALGARAGRPQSGRVCGVAGGLFGGAAGVVGAHAPFARSRRVFDGARASGPGRSPRGDFVASRDCSLRARVRVDERQDRARDCGGGSVRARVRARVACAVLSARAERVVDARVECSVAARGWVSCGSAA
jgi:hypothetical protein